MNEHIQAIRDAIVQARQWLNYAIEHDMTGEIIEAVDELAQLNDELTNMLKHVQQQEEERQARRQPRTGQSQDQ